MSKIPDPNQAAPMGEFVRRHLPQLLAYCQANPEEFANLQDKKYCLATFRQSYPVLTPRHSDKRPDHYWAAKSSAPFTEAGYWVTSEWVAGLHTAHFVTYLIRKGIEPIGIDDDFATWAQDTVDAFGTTGSAPGGPRYRATPLGAVQNALIRHLLGSLEYEAFTRADWESVKNDDFGGACAYCEVVGKTELDHATPINRIHLGEHRLGNLAPACATCNGQKSNQQYVAYLSRKHRGDPGRARTLINSLETHAARHGYQPIEAPERISPILEEARAKLKELADFYRNQINQELNASQGSLASVHRTVTAARVASLRASHALATSRILPLTDAAPRPASPIVRAGEALDLVVDYFDLRIGKVPLLLLTFVYPPNALTARLLVESSGTQVTRSSASGSVALSLTSLG